MHTRTINTHSQFGVDLQELLEMGVQTLLMKMNHYPSDSLTQDKL